MRTREDGDHVVTCPTCGQPFGFEEHETGSAAYFGLRPQHRHQPSGFAEALGSAAQALYQSVISRIARHRHRRRGPDTDDVLMG